MKKTHGKGKKKGTFVVIGKKAPSFHGEKKKRNRARGGCAKTRRGSTKRGFLRAEGQRRGGGKKSLVSGTPWEVRTQKTKEAGFIERKIEGASRQKPNTNIPSREQGILLGEKKKPSSSEREDVPIKEEGAHFIKAKFRRQGGGGKILPRGGGKVKSEGTTP